MKPKILIVDDTEDVRSLLRAVLDPNYQLQEVVDGASLKQVMEGPQPDLVLLDLKLPDADGLELLPPIKRRWPETEVIILTGHASLDNAVVATKLGAYDFLQKPFDPKALSHSVERALEHKSLTEEASHLRKALLSMSGGAAPIFQSAAMKSVVKTVERVAPSDVSIFITGESGTGKEVIADLLHALSLRSKGPIIKVNCAALPRELIESELFGSVKGAYTGAHADRDGLFRQSEGGTLFLDEISEMPIDTQSKLLRVLQEKEVRPVGGRASYKMDCRVVAATNRRVEDAIKDGKLREDLFYRISAITIELPPLRDRREEIMPLATAFLQRFSAQAGRVFQGFAPVAQERLRSFDWPGNIRQLQNEIQRAVLISDGPLIDVCDLSVAAPKPAATDTPDYSLMEAMERNTILQVLKETSGNKVETAKRLGIGRQTLYNKIKTYGIEA